MGTSCTGVVAVVPPRTISHVPDLVLESNGSPCGTGNRLLNGQKQYDSCPTIVKQVIV